MRKTDNYGLALYDKEDNMTITAEEDSLNHNMEIIDETLKEKATINDITTYVEEHKEELKGDTGEAGSDGLNGTDGLSAYQIWLKQGNTGTEQDFLDSLKGADGINGVDGKDGINGTKGIDGKDGVNGADGEDGYSPTATVTQTDTGATITITDKNGTTTTNITNGRDGIDGANGQDGKDGTNGLDGENGATFTPIVDSNGNLSWTNDKGLSNPATVNIKGEKGDKGETGADGYTPVKGTDYFTEADKEEMVETVSEELSEELGLTQINLFNYEDITTGYNRNNNVGRKITDYYAVNDGFYSNQVWKCKQGDIIRCNMSWANMLIYDASGVLIEKWTTQESGTYEVTSETASQFTYQGVSYQASNKVMITLNREMPSTTVEYTPTLPDRVTALEKNSSTKKYFDKAFMVLSFDAFNLDDNRFEIVNNEYGYKATVAHKTVENIDINKTVLDAGWDIGLYLLDNTLYPPTLFGSETAVSLTPTEEVLNAWDTYVKTAVEQGENAMAYNPVVWLARQGCSCYGLETALKKYGIPMCRGSYNPDYSNDWAYSPDELPTMTVASETLMPSALEDCKTSLAEAVENGTGVAFLTHGIYATDDEANSGYGVTEECLRSFLDTVKTYVDAGTLEVVTYRDIYRMYYEEKSRELDYNRIIKMINNKYQEIAGLVDVETIPDYVKEEAYNVVKKVLPLLNDECLVGLAISDMHQSFNATVKEILPNLVHAGQGMAEIKKHIPLDFCACLGDFVGETYGDNYDNGNNAENAKLVISWVKKAISDAFSNTVQLWTPGNHDVMSDDSDDNLTASELYPILSKASSIVRPKNNRIAGYGYYDFEDYKVRILLLNSMDFGEIALHGENPEIGGQTRVSAVQLQWIVDTLTDLSTKEDVGEWKVIPICHHPLNWTPSHSEFSSGGATYQLNIKNALTILDAYNSKASGSVTMDGTTINYDFSSVGTGYVILQIHGHLHNFNYATIGSFLRVCIPNACSDRENQYGGEWQDETTYSKTENSAKDTAFNIVVIDLKNNLLHCINYGAGVDRTVKLPEKSEGYINLIPLSVETDGTPYNGGQGWKADTRLNSSGTEVALTGIECTGFIPVKYKDIVRFKNISWAYDGSLNTRCYVCFYDANKTLLSSNQINFYADANGAGNFSEFDENNNMILFNAQGIKAFITDYNNVAYMRISAETIDDTSIITVNEIITD